MRGSPDFELSENCDPKRPIEAIYSALDQWGVEIYPENTDEYHRLSCFVALPPLHCDGVFTKGLLFTDAADLLCERLPYLKSLFYVFGYTMSCSYSRSEHADGIFALYTNPAREAWWRAQHPQRANKTLVPLLDSDFIHEYFMRPRAVSRDVDILCIARLDRLKNLPMLAAALRILRAKHPQTPYRMTWVIGRDTDINYAALTTAERDVMRQMQTELGYMADYIDIIPRVDWPNMPFCYAKARCYVLASLCEGKNRGMLEAMACDAPVVCFADYNKFARGDTPIFPPNAGLCAPHFDAESLADTLYTLLSNRLDFQPRRALMEMAGRQRVLSTLIEAIPELQRGISNYVPGNALGNRSLDLAMSRQHQVGLFDFLYTPSNLWTPQYNGLVNTEAGLDNYRRQFNA